MLTRDQLFTLIAITLLATVFAGGVGWAIAAGDDYQTPAERTPESECESPSVSIEPEEDGTGIVAEQECSTPDDDSDETPAPVPYDGPGTRH